MERIDSISRGIELGRDVHNRLLGGVADDLRLEGRLDSCMTIARARARARAMGRVR
jgi:hypothetical protein